MIKIAQDCIVKVMEKLAPVAINAISRVEALSLIHDGYVQADHNILCPQCGMRFLFLLDPTDRTAHRDMCEEIRGIMALLQAKIATDHIQGHSSDLFVIA
jgi:hypothetical protein